MTLPHSLSQAAAKGRVDEGLRMLAGFVGQRGTVQSAWQGDTADVRINALAQTATARVEVLPNEIRLWAQVPFLLSPFSRQIQGMISANAGKMLGAPGRPAPPGRLMGSASMPPRKPGLLTRLARRWF